MRNLTNVVITFFLFMGFALAAEEYVCKAPVHKVGDSWTYEVDDLLRKKKGKGFYQKISEIGRTQIRVSAVNLTNEGQVPTGVSYNEFLFTQTWGFVKRGNASYTQPAEMFKFPLDPKSDGWDVKYVIARNDGSRKTYIEGVAKVVGNEVVKTSAGTFRTCKVEFKGRYSNEGSSDSKGELTQTFLYSEELGRPTTYYYKDEYEEYLQTIVSFAR